MKLTLRKILYQLLINRKAVNEIAEELGVSLHYVLIIQHRLKLLSIAWDEIEKTNDTDLIQLFKRKKKSFVKKRTSKSSIDRKHTANQFRHVVAKHSYQHYFLNHQVDSSSNNFLLNNDKSRNIH